MTKTVVGLFDQAQDAQQAIEDLQQNGFARSSITVAKDASDTTALSSIAGLGMPAQDVQFYGYS